MEALTLARWQFAITTVYHFFFVPLTLGLIFAVALLETAYFITNKNVYKKMTLFWGRLFLINFAMGVVTGIVQEFQFGMNWSEFSRYVGDIFGAPLAIEALATFFMESVFIGVWVFGRNRIPKKMHLASIWLVALGSAMSAFWILTANTWMQNPIGYIIRNGRAEMVDFFALITNPLFPEMFLHVWFSGLATAAFFMLGISAYHLLKKSNDIDVFRKSFQLAAVLALISSILAGAFGHRQAQQLAQAQPMKLAAMEALWESEDPAGLSLFAVPDKANKRNKVELKVPYALSALVYNWPTGKVLGINEIQADYDLKYGKDDYIPSICTCFWTFRIMVGIGTLMVGLAVYAVVMIFLKSYDLSPKGLYLFICAIFLPYLACTAGWILTEVGRQPWVVQGLQKTSEAVSKSVTANEVLISMIVLTLLYGVLMLVDLFLLCKYSRMGTEGLETIELKEVA